MKTRKLENKNASYHIKGITGNIPSSVVDIVQGLLQDETVTLST